MNEKKKRKKILILDDEIGIRELIGEILTDEGYAVIALEKAEQAWKARVEENPSLVLLDIWMPELDGITMLKQWNEAGLNECAGNHHVRSRNNRHRRGSHEAGGA